MTLKTRLVDLDSERDRLTELLQRNLTELDHQRRFPWLYLHNPAGRAWSWFICDGDRVVGVTSVFPRFLWLGGRLEKCGQVVDFAVDRAYRSLGPALMLQRATLSPVDAGELALCYDCPPHDRGMSTFRRMGLEAACRMARFTKLLRVNDAIRKRLPFGAAIRAPMIAVGNFLLWCTSRHSSRVRGLEIEPHTGSFGEEFSELDQRLGAADGGVRSRRRAEDLNWRYRSNPLAEYRVLAARHLGEIRGFAVFGQAHERIHLVDLVADSDTVRLELLHTLSELGREEGCETVTTTVVHPSRHSSMLSKAGFRYRAAAEHVVAYARDESTQRRIAGVNWQFGCADVMI